MASASRKQAVSQAAVGVDTQQALEAFRDPVWRLGTLCSIRSRDGSVIKFAPRPQQAQIIDLIYRQGCRRIIILKARQLGFSTLLGVICADRLCFGLGQQISLIDQTIEDARQKLRDIVLVAYDSLDPALKRELPITRSNTGELAVKFVRHEEAKTNAMFAGTHARGGANSFLWVSEWGVIQATDLARSEEILTGALPSVGDGICVCESTWRGGRNGHLWSLVKSALETPEEQKGPLDWRVVFFPWQHDPNYRDAVPRPVGEETVRYFAGLPASAGEFSPGQMSWYQRKRGELGMFVKREFPTVLEECFQAPVERGHLRGGDRPLKGRRLDKAVDRGPLVAHAYCLGLGLAAQYDHLVFSAWPHGRGAGNRLRCGPRLASGRACRPDAGQGVSLRQPLPAS
jgi:hypothetical protein